MRYGMNRARRWRSWLRHCATSQQVACSIPDVVIGIFCDLILRPHYGPEVDSASNRNEYQGYLLGDIRPVLRADNLTTFMCRLSWNSGSPDLLEPSGPVQACLCFALSLILELRKQSIFILIRDNSDKSCETSNDDECDNNNNKVNQSRYRPEVAQRVPGS